MNMEISKHGHLRAMDRTRMLPEDVLSVVKSGMVVPLGFVNGCEFLLFYSPFDRDGKIAVVSEERTLLISVWEPFFTLPAGIIRPTRDMVNESKRLFNAFLFGKLGGNTKIFNPNDLLSVKVRAIYGEQIKGESDLSAVTRSGSKDLKYVIDSSSEKLKGMVLGFEEEMISLRELFYEITVFDPSTPHIVERSHSIKHSTLADKFLLIEAMVFVRVQVMILDEVQYDYKDLTMMRSKSKSLELVISCLREDFQSLVDAVISCGVPLNHVRYKINFINSKTLLPSVDPLIVKHDNFVRLLTV